MDLILVDTRSGKRRTVALSQRGLLVGRGVDCDVVLPDESVGDHCCRITPSGATVGLEALSPEGVTINGFAARRAEIHAGDVVRIGVFQIVVAAHAAAPPPAPAAPARVAAPARAVAPARVAAPVRVAAAAVEEPRPVSSRRRPEKSSHVVPIVVSVVVLIGAAGFGLWFWKSHVATPDAAPAVTPVATTGTDAAIGKETSSDAPPTPESSPRSSEAPNSAAAPQVTPPAASANGQANGTVNGSGTEGHAPSGDAPAASKPTPTKDDSAAASDPNKPTPSEELWRTLERVGRLLEYEEYSRCRWLLSQQRPGTPKERANVEALRQKVDAAAAKAGDEYLKFVEQLIAKGWILPALNHLQDESIERFRGLAIWYALTERADLLEDEVDKVCPAERRPVARVKHGRPRPNDVAALPPPPIGVTDTEREMDGVTASNRAATSSAAGTPVHVSDPLAEARRALEALKFDEAAVVLETMPRSQLTAARESSRKRMASWAAAAKRSSGAGASAPQGAAPPQGAADSGLDEKAAKALLAATRAKEHTPREWLDVAWFAMAARDDAAFDDALAKAAADAALKEEVDSALAFHRGLDGVPQGGFACVDGRWLTAAERDTAAARGALDAAMGGLATAKEGSLRDATARLVEAAKASPATASEILRGRCKEVGAKMAEAAEKSGLNALRARVQALSDARAAALTFAFDDASYPPAAASDANAVKKLTDANRELDKRVQAVRQIWGNEQGGAPEPCVDLSDDYASLVRQSHALEAALAAIHATAPDDPEFAAARLLPGFTAKVSVRNYALNVEERRRIDADREVKARNQVAKETKNAAELELLNLINAYREMLGVPQVAFDPRLYGDAHGYSEVMALQTKKERDDAPQPDQKLATEKPQLIPGELYLRGKFSARQAQQAWLHIAAGHRDILFAKHKAAGPANVGNFWTCTFGVNEPESK